MAMLPAGKDFSRRRHYAPYTFFYHVAAAGRLEQLSINMQTQSVCVRDEVDLRCSVIIIAYVVWLF